MSAPSPALTELLDLSHQLGREERALAILGEGNTSRKLSEQSFIVKASGSNLATLAPENVTECRFADLAALLEKSKLTDTQVDDSLLAARERWGGDCNPFR